MTTTPAPGRPVPDASNALGEAAASTAATDPGRLPAPPWSRAVRRTVGGALVVAGLLNGGLQYLEHLLVGTGGRAETIAWGLANPGPNRVIWFGVMLSSTVLLIGLLGLAQVTRWHSRRLTLAATVLTVWGMAGFGNILAGTYIANVVAPEVLGVDGAVRLIEEGYLADWGMGLGALVPHLVGSFLGLLLLAVAAWRSGLPKVPLVLLVAFLVWDFTLEPFGVLEPHLLLMVALAWLGAAVIALPHDRWLGRTSRPGAVDR